MSGLSKVKARANELKKHAQEGSLENNLKQLITDEAYTQLSQKFPSLVPMIVGVNIVEVMDDNTALGGVVIASNDKRLVVPVVYTNGNVDATTFIYNEGTDILLALTKKIVKFITSTDGSFTGSVVSPDQQDFGFDTGNIDRVFIPPKTYSPKIASGESGLLMAVLEKSASFREAVVRNLSRKDFREEFSKMYGEDAVSYINSIEIEKTASSIDTTEPEVLFSLEKIASSNWEHKKEAAIEFAKNGFVISHGVNAQKKSLEKIATIETRLKEITGDEALESVDFDSPGVYTVYRKKDLKPTEVVVANDFTGRNPNVFGKTIKTFGGDGVNKGNPIIGKRISVSESSIIEPFNGQQFSDNARYALIFKKDNSIMYGISRFGDSMEVEKGLGSTIIKLDFAHPIDTINIEKNSSASPVILGSTIYVGDKNIGIIKLSEGSANEQKKDIPIRMRDLDAAYNRSGDIVKVAFDGVEYNYNNNVYSKHAIVTELLKEGYDKASIYNLVKTAAGEGSAEMIAINAKLDMLASMITNLAGQVQAQQIQQQQGLASIPAVDGQAMTDEDIAQAAGEIGVQSPDGSMEPQQQIDAETAAAMQQYAPQDGTMMQDPYTGIPTEEMQAAQEQAMQEQALQDQALLQQSQQAPQEMTPLQDAGMAGQMQGAGMDGQGPQLQDGMNTSIDPAILSTLSQLKDSSVMDVGVISMLANNDSMTDIIEEYSGDIISGANALGRILLNAMTKKNRMVDDIGEKKYNQMIKNLKLIFVKTSDLYADMLKMELESDGKMED